MPRPWKKKSRVSRISQLVADLQSPKNGSPLVVQTGFPTSLIDLFVKNRDRLKKSSSKRKSLIETEDGMRMPNPTRVVSPPAPTGDCVVEGENLAQPTKEIESISEDHETDGDSGNGLTANGDFVSVLKLFVTVMVVLGLSIKKLAIGITMSAFCLLFLEYVGRRLERSYNKKLGIRSLIGRVTFRLETLVLKRVDLGDDTSRENEDVKSSSSTKEIQIAESDHCNLVEEIQIVKNDSEKGDCIEEHHPTIKEFLELEDDRAELSVSKDKHRKASKLVKKFFSKKLQNMKKEKKNKEQGMEVQNEESSRVEVETYLSRHESIEKRESGVKGNSIRSQLREEILREGREQQELTTGVNSSRESCRKEAEMSVPREKREGERKKKSGYLILLLIVLAGLLGGRMLAFIITIAWCVMLKLVGNLRIS